jgi:hypothetical protein
MLRRTLLAAIPMALVVRHILNPGDVIPGRMTGGYAGAMSQLMTSAHRHDAVHVEGNGRRDIRTSTADNLASIGNADDIPGAHLPATQADRQTGLPMRTHPTRYVYQDPAVQSSPVKVRPKAKFQPKAEGYPGRGDDS